MNCPYCNQYFMQLPLSVLLPHVPNPFPFPMICSLCAEISMLHAEEDLRKVTPEELKAIKQSEIWPGLGRTQMEIQRRNVVFNN